MDIKQKESVNLDAWREQVEEARRGQEASCRLTQEEAAYTYEEFLGSMFSYYGENAIAAERATEQG